MGLVDPMGQPVSSAALAAADRKARGVVGFDDVTHDTPATDVTSAHYRVRAFYRKLAKGGQRDSSVLQDIAACEDRGWLQEVLDGLDDGRPGPSTRTRRRWRAAIAHRLSVLPQPEPSGPPVPEIERIAPAAEMAR